LNRRSARSLAAATLGLLAAHAAAPAQASAARAAGPIEHVVFVIQENRSFNNLFMGYPGAVTATYGYDTQGQRIALHAQTLPTQWDIDHSARAFFAAMDGGKLDGWNKERVSGARPPAHAQYAYVPRNETKPYWDLAQQYVLADNAFASQLDGSFTAHQYAIAAYSGNAVDYPSAEPWGCAGGPSDTIPTLTQNRKYGPPEPVCFTYQTLGQEADAAGVSWRSYTGSIYGDGGLWNGYQAISAIYNGPDWTANVVNPPAQFLTDVKAGQLAAITWVTPTYEASDHGGMGAGQGPAWVASVVNAVGHSKFWKSTAIFVMWDDWGGWFDPVPPPTEDYDGLGFRVPLIMISPYAKAGYVTHVQYETASVLRFAEDTFGLPQMAAADARAADPASDAFDYSQPPRPYKRIGGAQTGGYRQALGSARGRALDPAFGD